MSSRATSTQVVETRAGVSRIYLKWFFVCFKKSFLDGIWTISVFCFRGFHCAKRRRRARPAARQLISLHTVAKWKRLGANFITNLSKMCESFLTLRRLRFPFPFFLVFVFLQNPEKYLIKSSPAFTKSRNYFRLFCETANRFLVFFFGGGDFWILTDNILKAFFVLARSSSRGGSFFKNSVVRSDATTIATATRS